MFAASALFLDALRAAHTAAIKVDAWRDGVKVASDLQLLSGEVTVDAGSKVRRQMSATLAAEKVDGVDLWDVLSPVGTELRPYRGIRFPSSTVEWVPLGIFVIDVQAIGYAPGGQLSITAPDRWVTVQRARFETPQAAVSGALIRAEMARLAREPVGVTSTVTASSGATVGSLVWERDRDEAVEKMGSSIGAEAFFDVEGNVIVRDVPTVDDAVVWDVDAGSNGVLLDANRERNRQRTYNVVVVATAEVDGTVPFDPVVVEDTDPLSPTYVDGPFGRVPYFFTSPLLTSTAQATQAGQTILERVRGLAAQLTVQSVVNPALDAGDVIDVKLRTGLVERHVIDRVTIPLTVDGAQSIDTRSSVADEEEA